MNKIKKVAILGAVAATATLTGCDFVMQKSGYHSWLVTTAVVSPEHVVNFEYTQEDRPINVLIEVDKYTCQKTIDNTLKISFQASYDKQNITIIKPEEEVSFYNKIPSAIDYDYQYGFTWTKIMDAMLPPDDTLMM